MAKIIQTPFGFGRFTIVNSTIHKLSQSELASFLSSGPVMGFLFETLMQREYANVTGVRVVNQKKDLVIQDPSRLSVSTHWEAKGFKTSESEFAGRSARSTEQIIVDVGASSETGSGRKADISKSLDKMRELEGYILHIPGTYPDIYHYQLPIDVVKHHRLTSKTITLATTIEELRAAGFDPPVPRRIRGVPITHDGTSALLSACQRASTTPIIQAA